MVQVVAPAPYPHPSPIVFSFRLGQFTARHFATGQLITEQFTTGLMETLNNAPPAERVCVTVRYSWNESHTCTYRCMSVCVLVGYWVTVMGKELLVLFG